MEEASGQKLQWFFDQWVYTPGYPRLEMQQKYNASTGQLQLTLSQVQKTDTGMPPAFRFPLDVEILTASGAVNQTFEITKRIRREKSRPAIYRPAIDIQGRPRLMLIDLYRLPRR
jgi:aminopeptidase N